MTLVILLFTFSISYYLRIALFSYEFSNQPYIYILIRGLFPFGIIFLIPLLILIWMIKIRSDYNKENKIDRKKIRRQNYIYLQITAISLFIFSLTIYSHFSGLFIVRFSAETWNGFINNFNYYLLDVGLPFFIIPQAMILIGTYLYIIFSKNKQLI